MNWKDYKRYVEGQGISVGTIGGQYCFEILTGICDVPEYYPISKEEFDSFDTWKSDTEKIVKDIKNRRVLCSAYRVNKIDVLGNGGDVNGR